MNSASRRLRRERGGSVVAKGKCNKRSIDADVVEIGGIDNLGVQLDASYGLLLNLLPNLPADAERRPLKQRKVPRHRTATR